MSVNNNKILDGDKESKNSNSASHNKIVKEISINDDNSYFGELSKSEEKFNNIHNNHAPAHSENCFSYEEDKQDLRRSQRRITRQSFAAIPDHFLTMNEAPEDDEYRLIK